MDGPIFVTVYDFANGLQNSKNTFGRFSSNLIRKIKFRQSLDQFEHFSTNLKTKHVNSITKGGSIFYKDV